MGNAQEVCPSQELILDRGEQKGQKSKTLYMVDGVAGMHRQKIGNALRVWLAMRRVKLALAD